MTVTTFQWGFTTKGIECPTGVIFDGEEYVPTWDPDPEIICLNCNCPCADSEEPCNKAAPGAAENSTSLELCGKTERRYCTNGPGSSTSMEFTHPGGGSIYLNPTTGIVDPTGIDFSDLPNPTDTIIEGGEGLKDTPCGTLSSGGPCFCSCCPKPDPADCEAGSSPCSSCSEDTPPTSAPNGSMCGSSGFNIIYRKMCMGGGSDPCTILANGGDCGVPQGNCTSVPVVIISWQSNVDATPIPSTEGPPGSVDGFDIVIGGPPIGGPGAMGACNCQGGGGGSETISSDFDELYPSEGEEVQWPDNNIRNCP